MKEYRELLNYLNTKIREIEITKTTIQRKKAENKVERDTLQTIIYNIENLKLDDINIVSLFNILNKYLDDNQLQIIKKQIDDILSLKSFILDETFDNPIKKKIISDLMAIKQIIVDIHDNIKDIEIDKHLLEDQAKCQKFLEIVNDEGYTRVLLPDERKEFLEFLQFSDIDFKLLLISNYYIFASKNIKQKEKEKLSTQIEVINEQSNAVIAEIKETESEILDETVKKINAILEEHEVDEQEYKDMVLKYNQLYGDKSIYEISDSRGEWISLKKINWEIAIPCIKSVLLPNITGESRTIVIRLLKTIIDTDNFQKNKVEEIVNKDNKKLTKLKKAFKYEKQLFKVFKKNICKFMDDMQRLGDILIIARSLIDGKDVKGITNPDEFLKKIPVSKGSIILYGDIISIEQELEFVDAFLNGNIEIKEENDINYVSKTIENINEKINDVKVRYKAIISPEPIPQIVNEPVIANNPKQYQYGGVAIVFYRENEDASFAISSDIENLLSRKDVKAELKWILESISSSNQRILNISDITLAKNNKKKQKGASFTIKTRNNIYHVKRIRKDAETDFRIVEIDVNMCKENRDKLGIGEKNIALIVSGGVVKSFSNEGKTYAKFRRKISSERNLIDFIEQLENPNTDVEWLQSLFVSSSELYEGLTNTRKIG